MGSKVLSLSLTDPAINFSNSKNSVQRSIQVASGRADIYINNEKKSITLEKSEIGFQSGGFHLKTTAKAWGQNLPVEIAYGNALPDSYVSSVKSVNPGDAPPEGFGKGKKRMFYLQLGPVADVTKFPGIGHRFIQKEPFERHFTTILMRFNAILTHFRSFTRALEGLLLSATSLVQSGTV